VCKVLVNLCLGVFVANQYRSAISLNYPARLTLIELLTTLHPVSC
jgi:hypothetical protein